MSLPRKTPREIPRASEEIKSTSTEIILTPEPPNPQQWEYIPKEELDRIWKRILAFQERNIQDLENKNQATLLFTMMNQICEVLTAFMTDTESQLKTMNEQQLSLLKLQKRCVAEVQGEVDSIYNKTYYVMQQKQEEVLKAYEKHISEKLAKFEQTIEKATAKSNQSAKRVEVVNEKLFKVKKWWDLMQYAAPVAVLLNFIFRVFQHFAGG